MNISKTQRNTNVHRTILWFGLLLLVSLQVVEKITLIKDIEVLNADTNTFHSDLVLLVQ